MSASRREETIFAEALGLPPEERAAYLAEATGDDPELREEVESLLRNHGSGEFLEEAAVSELQATIQTPSATEGPGDRIGRYKLLQQIGEGGCGVVYMAEQTEPVRRRVALKVIKLGMDTKSVIARFEAERQALALMDHPNIAKVLDAGATETGRPYFVMELVRGMKITDYCDEKKLPPQERLDLFVEVCNAIQHAHQKGIVHRDLKPSNVLVTVNDGVAVPKVIDFGIAKATTGQQLTDKTLFTAFEQFIGTPAYMSPEQAELTSLDIDTRSDIYTLGVLLYELMTGRTPFDATELLEIGLDEMRRTIREAEPPKPSTRLSALAGQELSTTAQRRGLEAPKLVSELRGDLDWIVMKCLEKDRARRYESANGLAMDIQRHLNDEPVLACPPGRLYRLQKTVRRHKLACAAVGAVFLALLIGLGTSAWMFAREREAKIGEQEAKDEQVRLRQLADERAQSEREAKEEQTRLRKVADEDAATVRALNEFMLLDLLPQASSSVQAKSGFKPNPNLTLREALDRAASSIGDRFEGRPLQEARVRVVIGSVYRRLSNPKRAIPHQERGVELHKGEQGLDHPHTVAAMASLADSYRVAGMLHEAIPLFEKTWDLMKDLHGADHPDTRRLTYDLALAYKNAGKLDLALPLAEQNYGWYEDEHGPDNRDTLGAANTLGDIYRRVGRLDDAIPLVEDTLKRMERTLGPRDPWTANAMANLANCYKDAGRFEEEAEMVQLLVDLREEIFGPDDYRTLSVKGGRVVALRNAGKFKEALKLAEDILGKLTRTPGPRHPTTLAASDNLAQTLRAAGDAAGAEGVYREALAHLRPPGQEPEHELPQLGSVLYQLADVLREQGKLEEARQRAEESVAAYERHPAWPESPRQHAPRVLEQVLKELGEQSDQPVKEPSRE